MSIVQMLQRLPAPALYAGCVALEKGVSIFIIPLMASYLPPAEYGRFDVAVSLIECTVLIMELGVGFTLMRFASTAKTDEDAAQCARELLGNCLVVALIVGTIIQIIARPLADALGINVDMTALRWSLASATVMGLVNIPLVWLRLKDKALAYVGFTLTRTAAQVVFLWLVLRAGFGSTGVLYANAAVILLLAVVLVATQIAQTGIAVSWPRWKQMLRYGAPLVGAALAMFALGNANRLFLPGNVDETTIAHFGLAARLAVAAWLLMYPFDLWWHPKRIAVLSEPNGLQRSREVWGIGFSILMTGVLGVALAGPIFIHLFFPEGYQGALHYLPVLLIAILLHQTAILCATGCFAEDHGYSVFWIDLAGAAVAIIGYLVLIPRVGAMGAAYAMIAGNALRLGLYLVFGNRLAPIDYPWGKAALLLAVCVLGAALAPTPDKTIMALAWATLSALAAFAVMLTSRLVPMPETITTRLRGA